jgi:hypothetical protein
MKLIDRFELLVSALLASYQVVQGIDGLSSMAIACYTIGFGVFVIASLLMIILGFEVLESPWVVIVSSLIPLSLALGLVSEYIRPILIPYGIFTIVGFLAIFVTRLVGLKKPAVIVLAIVHGIAGLLIFMLPVIMTMRNITSKGFILVGVGGMLIGLGGLFLSFLKAGRPILPRERILAVFPTLLMLTTFAFVAGFAFN